jgi:hypothetical protein
VQLHHLLPPTCKGAMLTASAPSGRLCGCSSAMIVVPSSEGRTRERPRFVNTEMRWDSRDSQVWCATNKADL